MNCRELSAELLKTPSSNVLLRDGSDWVDVRGVVETGDHNNAVTLYTENFLRPPQDAADQPIPRESPQPSPTNLRIGQTVRVEFAADHWIDVTNDGEVVRVHSPRGVMVLQNEPNWLTVFTRDEIEP